MREADRIARARLDLQDLRQRHTASLGRIATDPDEAFNLFLDYAEERHLSHDRLTDLFAEALRQHAIQRRALRSWHRERRFIPEPAAQPVAQETVQKKVA